MKETPFEEVLLQYRPLILSLCKKYHLTGKLDESIAVAEQALYETIQSFNPERGPFGAYAKRFIQGRLLTYMQKEIRWYQTHTLPGINDEHNESWESQIPDDNPYRGSELSPEIEIALAQLTERERVALIHFYVQDRPLQELATRFGVSHSTVTTWRNRGLQKMKRMLREKVLN